MTFFYYLEAAVWAVVLVLVALFIVLLVDAVWHEFRAWREERRSPPAPAPVIELGPKQRAAERRRQRGVAGKDRLTSASVADLEHLWRGRS